MTDDVEKVDRDVILRAYKLCDRGVPLPNPEMIKAPLLRKIVGIDDELQARYLVPALLEIIQRRELKPPYDTREEVRKADARALAYQAALIAPGVVARSGPATSAEMVAAEAVRIAQAIKDKVGGY